jgi:hypothetical protein
MDRKTLKYWHVFYFYIYYVMVSNINLNLKIYPIF